MVVIRRIEYSTKIFSDTVKAIRVREIYRARTATSKRRRGPT
jgi:hypothetical protein